MPVIEIKAKQDFYNFDNKYPFLNPNAAGADHFCPAPLSPEVTRLVQETGIAAHRALGLEVYSRVDILLSDAGEPFVLEVNTIPGMTPSSLLPEAAAAAGISYPELCRRIVELSLARFPST
jgi:D-alanine-D-alanine ligase